MAVRSRTLVSNLALVLSASLATAADLDAPPLNYTKVGCDNDVSRLIDRLNCGKSKLVRDGDHGYVRALLRELDVPESSQVLVFSKTSLQRHRIGPKTPRAIYFNDDVYVGFCLRGDVVELSAADPQIGTVFYTLDQHDADAARITRQTDSCLICHASSQNHGLPGHLVRSVFTNRQGQPLLTAGSFRTDYTSPLAERWGGWYVTGTSGSQMHLGNLIAENGRVAAADNGQGVNITDLSDRFTTGLYPTPHSDVLALMVLEQQVEGHNRLARANLLTRIALHEEAELNKALGRPADYRSESTTSRIRNAGEPLVKYLLFSGEARLTDRITGTSSFAHDFANRGPRDRQGRSLRDFGLERRLFKYPLSYLIYSRSFDALPGPVHEYVLRRLWEVLSGRDTSKDFEHLAADDRRAILEILRDTKPGLPDDWRGP